MYRHLIGFTVLCLSGSGVMAAEGTPKEYCTQAAQLFEEEDIEGAIEEARWCLESLEQIQQERKSEKFAQEIDGWKRGKLNQQKVMGFSTIETRYTKGNKEIQLAYNSGSGGGMGAIFSQMGMAQAGRKIRIQRYTGIVMDESSNPELMIMLKQSGAMLNLSSSSASMDELIGFAKKLPLKEIDQ